MIEIERYLRQAIVDSVSRASRKPFVWGGLQGYQQLQAIAQALAQNRAQESQRPYLELLQQRVERVLSHNRALAEDLRVAHGMLAQVAACLHYPPPQGGLEGVRSREVRRAMQTFLANLHPNGIFQPAQTSLISALRKRWKQYGAELLPCYNISGLPPDNLRLESLFGGFRRHQRRISGRKSTRELDDFGQVQVLFQADTQQDLLEQLQQAPFSVYLEQRKRLENAEQFHRFFRRFHHNPLVTIQSLLAQHTARSRVLQTASYDLDS